MATILLTGGMGYIGSHTATELFLAGFDVIIADDLSNSRADVLDKIALISGKLPVFYKVDVACHSSLERIFSEHSIDAVIHFAGFKAVGESVANPTLYYRNNLGTTLTLLETMAKFAVKRIVFSSSATVYGSETASPMSEVSPVGGCANPYGWTKFMVEQMLRDLAVSDGEYSVMLLRYFNPVGAHESGLIGENPNGVPNNLMPYISQVASGLREKLYVFGGDYPTADGTGVRDYIHVTDLALGHLAALEFALNHVGCEAVNLGTGVGYSVLDVVHAFESATKIAIPYEITDRRAGDIASYYADPKRAKKVLGWQATRSLETMCHDAWHWEIMNK